MKSERGRGGAATRGRRRELDGRAQGRPEGPAGLGSRPRRPAAGARDPEPPGAVRSRRPRAARGVRGWCDGVGPRRAEAGLAARLRGRPGGRVRM